MNLSDLSAVSQIAGALAVILSLLYVSRQIRLNTHAIRTANATALQTEFRALARTLYSDRETSRIVLRVMSGQPAETPAEQLAGHAWFFDLIKMAELGHFHYRNGDLDPELWHASVRFYRTWFDSPGVRAYWATRRSVFVPEFQAAMDEWLGKPMEMTRPDQLAAQRAGDDQQREAGIR